ncbi:MAG TPA: hypothetical protein VIS54_02780 [Psychromonas sp.]
MKIQVLVRKILSLLLFVILSLFLISCGGGGQDNIGINYTGSTERAIIDADNAAELALGGYFGGPIDENYWNMLVLDEQSEPFAKLRTIVPNSDTDIGNCGGSKTVTVNIDNTNGEFYGAGQFSDYCEDGVTTSGTVDIAGSADLNTGEIINISMESDQLTVASESSSVSISGKILNEFGPGSLIQTMNYLIRNNSDRKVYKIEDYKITTEIITTGTVEITFESGLYYHPVYGYVELESVTPFILYDGVYGVDSGELLVTGGAHTKALLSVINADQIEIKADTNGDGDYDWSSGILDLPYLKF